MPCSGNNLYPAAAGKSDFFKKQGRRETVAPALYVAQSLYYNETKPKRMEEVS